MIKVRQAKDRGHSEHGWLDSRHTFSFAEYYDPANMGFHALRVINDDRVAGGRGFGSHPHKDMEIVSYVLEGSLEHKDSMGTGSVIRPGDVQRMTAGTGVVHSEANASRTDGVHFLQIWIVPDRARLTPSYEQKAFPLDDAKGKLLLVASPDGRDGSVTVHQDVAIHAGRFASGDAATVTLAPGRAAWVHVARGALTLNGLPLAEGDGAAIENESTLTLTATSPSELLVFDLA
jgi:redox-sensitive bicupin YhaK (pirin superfamily)